MNAEEAQLFVLTLTALQEQESGKRGLIDNAEPMTATCTVERSDGRSAESVADSNAKVKRSDE